MAQVKHTDPFKLGWTEDIVLPAHTKLLRMDKLRLEALKMLHKTVLPITYQPKFYERLYGQARDHSYLAEHRGVLVGDISCRFEAEKDNRMYIMTLCVLEPYRKNGIGATLLRNVMQDVWLRLFLSLSCCCTPLPLPPRHGIPIPSSPPTSCGRGGRSRSFSELLPDHPS
eukprot:TRINITY_DN6187_c0_g1_i3.p3 TRINITY_DN6187_c0_g1~~TRINITY_DN6187_c0_g1_i3.p3  ORF type:complete len:187 (+),score=46.92 TRINITY_DN6187_c0_g1_i3:54-563(+)